MILHDLILTEHVVNLHTPEQKKKYAAAVWDLLQKSYEKIGGFKSAASPEELIHDSGLWKVITRGGVPTAVNIYKDKFGRKSIAIGTDLSIQGKRDYAMIKDEDIRFKRAWAEVSGAVEKYMIRVGAKPLPSRFAPFLTGKKILEVNPDGVHYTRLISGHPHEKVIYGFVNLSATELEELEATGVTIHELPSEISVKTG